jgi:hypothetical protein
MEIGHMSRRVTWNGTTDEALALLHALGAHCNCRLENGKLIAPCPPHLMLTHDQRAIDGLLFMRRMADRLLSEEFAVEQPATQQSSAAFSLRT